jgi:hypothetical protein
MPIGFARSCSSSDDRCRGPPRGHQRCFALLLSCVPPHELGHRKSRLESHAVHCHGSPPVRNAHGRRPQAHEVSHREAAVPQDPCGLPAISGAHLIVGVVAHFDVGVTIDMLSLRLSALRIGRGTWAPSTKPRPRQRKSALPDQRPQRPAGPWEISPYEPESVKRVCPADAGRR